MLNEGQIIEMWTKIISWWIWPSEHVEAIKGTKGDACKINAVRKQKGALSTHESLGTRGFNSTNYGRINLEVSSISWFPFEGAKRNRNSKVDMINEYSFKTWNKFMQWLRHKKVTTMKDFKVVIQRRGLHD